MTAKLLRLATLCASVVIPLRAQTSVGTALRADITLNGAWQCVLNQPQVIPTSGWTPGRAPALPVSDGTTSIWYQQSLTVPQAWIVPGRRFFIKLGQAGHYAAVYVNGTFAGDHFGQYSPFKVEVTPSIVAGANEIQIYIHDADDTYSERGVTLDQSGCAVDNPNCEGNAFRPAAPTDQERNWVGLTGNITFEWRPACYLSDVYIVPSVQNGTLTANVTVNGLGSGMTAEAQVFDGATSVLSLPNLLVVSGTCSLLAPWTNPTLWEPGHPKLYTLQTTLLQGSQVVDTRYDRFGFREVWVSGKQVLLNGAPLWLTGDYVEKLSPLRYVNDRRPQAFNLFVMESSGFNTVQSHWDDPGASNLDLADEMGLLVVGSFFCDGRPEIQSQIDNLTDWTNTMAGYTSEWVMAERNHPSIVIWRPADVLPQTAPKTTVYPALDAAIQALDSRPIADTVSGTIDTYGQNIQSGSTCDDGSALAATLASETKPLLVKEIYGDFGLSCAPAFFNTIYSEAFGKAVGVIIQQLTLFDGSTFTPSWESQSGLGNRPASGASLPDFNTRTWTPTAFSTQFAALYQSNVGALLHASPTSGDFETALPADSQVAFLLPANGLGNPIGAVADGSTVWLVTPWRGSGNLIFSTQGQDVTQPVTVSAPAPF
ncbi:MAG TPA: glycoside hydrolase family 2 TIM barrel-domain containing protein [Terriglobia bacterium]|nr:glycoside hydrolase family 2 TIM barrel-domain containing protein [Terriglobia bacterium]